MFHHNRIIRMDFSMMLVQHDVSLVFMIEHPGSSRTSAEAEGTAMPALREEWPPVFCVFAALLPSFLPSRLSCLIVFLISPNIIVIWPDDDAVYNQNFSKVKLLRLPITLSDWLPQIRKELASNRLGVMSWFMSSVWVCLKCESNKSICKVPLIINYLRQCTWYWCKVPSQLIWAHKTGLSFFDPFPKGGPLYTGKLCRVYTKK